MNCDDITIVKANIGQESFVTSKLIERISDLRGEQTHLYVLDMTSLFNHTLSLTPAQSPKSTCKSQLMSPVVLTVAISSILWKTVLNLSEKSLFGRVKN